MADQRWDDDDDRFFRAGDARLDRGDRWFAQDRARYEDRPRPGDRSRHEDRYGRLERDSWESRAGTEDRGPYGREGGGSHEQSGYDVRDRDEQGRARASFHRQPWVESRDDRDRLGWEHVRLGDRDARFDREPGRQWWGEGGREGPRARLGGERPVQGGGGGWDRDLVGRGRDDEWGLSQRRAFAQGLYDLAYGRSAGDYGRFENDDQDIRSHGGRFKSRDDDDQRYGMGLQGGAGRGRWAEDPRQDEEQGIWDRQVWAEDDRYRTRGARDLEVLHAARGDERWQGRSAGEEERFLRTEEAEPWPRHGRSEEDVRREMRERPLGWRPGR